MDQPAPPIAAVHPPDLSAEVRAAIDRYAEGLNACDPMQVGFNMTPVAMVVSDPTLPDCPLIYVNPAFEALTGFPAVEILGRNCRFMQGPLTEAADVERLRDAIAKREPIGLDLLNHRRDGSPFWNRLTVAPVFCDNGSLRYFVASQIDVTIERQRVAELEQDREQLSAKVSRLNADLAAHELRLKLALKAGSLGMWSLDLPELVLRASPGCKRIFGRPFTEDFSFDELLSAIHPDDLPKMQAAFRRSLEQGEPYQIEYRILTPAGEQRWVAIQGEMQYRADGTPLSMASVSSDISQRKFAEEHREVLARELTHRVKNSLATVNAIVSQTLRDASSLEEATATVSGRIASLGAAQELLIQDEVEGAPIDQIVERALLPFRDKEGVRFSVEGPSIRLPPEITLALAMVLHELATNAVKYGSLSVPDGRVAIRWSIGHQEGERRLRFTWAEQEGPPVTPPTRTGFGTRMILRMLRQHVRGEAAIRYAVTGATFGIELAL